METSIDATIVSVFPYQIEERKPGLNPELYIIPAAEDNDIAILNIGMANMTIYMGADAHPPTRQLPEFASQVANSLVWDYCRAQLEYKLDEASPGIFWVPGKLKKDEVKAKYSKEIEKARKLQARWFELLVRLADNSWNRTKSHREISELQRLAATKLGLKREWVFDYVSI